MSTQESLKAYVLGWSHGYDDEMPQNPFPIDAEEHKQYNEGYDEGSRNC